MTQTQKFFVQCLKFGLNNEKITALPQDIDYKNLIRLSYRHAVNSIVFYALGNLLKDTPKNFQEALTNGAISQMLIDTTSSYDSLNVINNLEALGIKYMPLKGYILKDFYPKPEMRYSSDCDILVEPKNLKHVCKMFKQMGYFKHKNDQHHDVYYNPSTKTVFEIHKKLFVGSLEKHFGIGFDKAYKDENSNYLYKYNANDFYISIIGHYAYHFDEGAGVGIRAICDIKVIKDHFKEKLDFDYIDKELDKCGLLTFKNELEQVEKFLFKSDNSASKFTKDLACYMLSSSLLENEQNLGANELAKVKGKKSKGKALFKKIFPPKENIYYTYSWLKKVKFLLPLGYVIRWFRVIFKYPKRLLTLKEISSVDNERINTLKYIKDGLKINGLMNKK